MTLLNIAEICPATRTLGPGQRFVIWVQGCCFNCCGCISPEWIPQEVANLVEPTMLAQRIYFAIAPAMWKFICAMMRH